MSTIHKKFTNNQIGHIFEVGKHDIVIHTYIICVGIFGSPFLGSNCAGCMKYHRDVQR